MTSVRRACAVVLLAGAAAQQAASGPGPGAAASTSPSEASAATSSVPVAATVAASKAEVAVGERFTVEVRASGPAGTSWTFPAEVTDEQVELRTAASPVAPEPTPGTHRYEASAFALGEARVPAVEVGYRLPDGSEGTVSTDPVPLRILSVLPKDPKEQKLADIRGPVGVSVGRVFWLVLSVLLAALAALAVWLLRRRRRAREPATPEAPSVPDAAAFAALDRLIASGLIARGEYRAFYIELAAIAKRYLEERLGAPVLEMTSAETVAFLRAHTAAHDLAPVVRDLATAADRIKFARGAGLADEAERHVAAVRGTIASLEERLRPRPAAGTEKVA